MPNCDAIKQNENKQISVFNYRAHTENPTNIKGTFRDHSRDNTLNFHKIQDLCILVMVLTV